MGFSLRFLTLKIILLFFLSSLCTIVNLIIFPLIIFSVPMLAINIILWTGTFQLIRMYNIRNLTIYHPFLIDGLEKKSLDNYYLLEYKNKKGINYILKLKCDLDKNQYKKLSLQRLCNNTSSYILKKQDYVALLQNNIKNERNKLKNAI